MTVDREQVRRDAEEIGDSPDLFRIHGFAHDVVDLLAELEEAERERDEARDRYVMLTTLAEWQQEQA